MKELKFELVKPSIDPTPQMIEVTDNRRDFILYGEDNLFPQYIRELYLHSAVMESIIKGMKDYVCGNGIIPDNIISDFSKCVNKDYDNIEDIVEKAVIDYIMYDGFAIQVFRDEDYRINEIYNLDFQNCRICTDEKHILYCENWEKYNSKTKKLPIFNREQPYRNSVFYFKSKNGLQSNVYPTPSYIGALSDIRTSVEISNFNLNSILNNFNVSSIISFNSGDVDDETKRRVEKAFEDKFCGTSNGAKIMLNFNENKDSAVSVEKLQSDDFADRYTNLEKETMKNIFISFRAIPQLFGFSLENIGFSNQEYDSAYSLYNRTVIKPIQKSICRAFSILFGKEDAIKIVPFATDSLTQNNE